jgi:hypothetical protein
MPTTIDDRKKILSGFGYSKGEIMKAEEERLQNLGYKSSNVSKLPKLIRKVQLVCAMANMASRSSK